MTSPRRRVRLDLATPHPAYVVWELTLRCDHACTHCGSRAGAARDDELNTTEALAVADQLAEMGTREVVLIGGEAYLHAGFLDVIARLAERGIVPILTTGGRGVTPELARDMAAAGLKRVSVSIDGLEATHDAMRSQRGSFSRALAALAAAREAGLRIAANTNLNRFNHRDLEGLFEVLRERGIFGWQVQLTTPLGRAADRTNMVLQPWDLLDVIPRVAALKARAREAGIELFPGNNLGYFGPEEGTLRSPRAGVAEHFQGCQAGRFVLGIESDGGVKGCPSLQSSHYIGGHLRERPLREIWDDTPELAFARSRTREDLWGFCRECVFADTCRGGCTFTAHALLGRPGNNPYCHYRAREFAKRGLRERLVPVEEAPGLPFDNGRFELVEEPVGASDPGALVQHERLVQLTSRSGRA
ncbi:MAG TPA: radical SAM protein [Polyangiaceae bacterium]|nr:radical SAM protein [Polyangiaceae bacterium]